MPMDQRGVKEEVKSYSLKLPVLFLEPPDNDGSGGPASSEAHKGATAEHLPEDDNRLSTGLKNFTSDVEESSNFIQNVMKVNLITFQSCWG